jgi:hypothetical protein
MINLTLALVLNNYAIACTEFLSSIDRLTRGFPVSEFARAMERLPEIQQRELDYYFEHLEVKNIWRFEKAIRNMERLLNKEHLNKLEL